VTDRRKLTDEQAAEIRRQYQAGKRPKLIAKQFSISYATIWMITHGRTHKPAD
jgi:DNA invertase Pin-like site-specific DNA recombinase